jgi:hypothetical protein
MATRAGPSYIRRWNKKNSFPGSLSALRSMVTVLKGKQRCVVKVLQVNKKMLYRYFLDFVSLLSEYFRILSDKHGQQVK